MIVTERDDRLVQVPEDGDTGGVLEAAVIGDVAQSDLRDWILFERKTIVEIDPEIAHENVERQLGSRGNKYAVGIVARVIHVEGVADAQVQLQGVELRDGPKDVDVHLRTYNEITLLLSSYQNGPRGTRDEGAGVFRQINIVVVLEAKSRVESQLHGSEL